MGRVYIVDDDDRIVRAMRRLVTSAGFHVETFTSPAELLGGPLPTAGDCVVVDVDMPEMSGPELRDALRARGCQSSFVFITAHQREEIARRVGTDPVLFKPIEAGVLMQTIESCSSPH